jgi:hypothetical protein
MKYYVSICVYKKFHILLNIIDFIDSQRMHYTFTFQCKYQVAYSKFLKYFCLSFILLLDLLVTFFELIQYHFEFSEILNVAQYLDNCLPFVK